MKYARKTAAIWPSNCQLKTHSTILRGQDVNREVSPRSGRMCDPERPCGSGSVRTCMVHRSGCSNLTLGAEGNSQILNGHPDGDFGQRLSLRAPEFGYFSTPAPAVATWPSCWNVPPDTPMAPTILPATISGRPPSTGMAPESTMPTMRSPSPPAAIAS